MLHYGPLISCLIVSPTALADGKAIIVFADGVVQDFDDLHIFRPFPDYVSASAIPICGAIDVGNVIWLGDDAKGRQAQTSIAPWQAAEALRFRDWQFTGLDRGAASPMDISGAGDVGGPLQASPTLDEKHENGVGIVYGIRGIQRQSSESVLLSGGILHDVRWQTEVENQILGPQLGVVFARRAGRLSTRLQATAMAGFNFGDVNQEGTIGQDLVPGALNQPLYARASAFSYGDRHDEISPSGEIRVEARYSLTSNTAFALKWSGIAIGNALLTDDRTNYQLPDFGLVDPGEQTIIVQFFYCGLEFVL